MARYDLSNYETVAQRIRRFKKDWPDSDIVTELVQVEGSIGSSRWVVKASIWREKGYERPDATGYAFEVDGSGSANATSALENCETSAIGRALANANYDGDLRNTREEMRKVAEAERIEEQKAEARKKYVAENTQRILDAEKAGDIAALKHALGVFSKQGDRELAGMTRETIERMEKNTPTPQQAQENVQEVLDAEVVPGEGEAAA